MNNELVKELASVRTWLAASDEYAIGVPSAEVSVAVIDRAIAFISSHDSVRDRALEECREAIWNENTRTHAREKLGMQRVMKLIDELKSAPFTHKDGTTSPDPQMYERHKGKDGACLSADTRGTVEDRRKSALGEPLIGDNNKRVEQAWGRRSNDSARWTGEAAPVVECLSCGDTKKMPYEPLNPSSKTYPCPYCMPQQSSATQPAQEAPPFREQDNLYEALSRVGDEIITLIARRRGDK